MRSEWICAPVGRQLGSDWRLLGPIKGTQIVFAGPENAIWVDLSAPWEEIGIAIGEYESQLESRST